MGNNKLIKNENEPTLLNDRTLSQKEWNQPKFKNHDYGIVNNNEYTTWFARNKNNDKDYRIELLHRIHQFTSRLILHSIFAQT